MSSADSSIHPPDSALASGIPLVPGSEFDSAFEAKVLAITSEYFPGSAEVEEMFDPQEPEERWRVIIVKAPGDPDDRLKAKDAWRERILREFGPENALRYTLFALP
jgi:hypothetical protein